MGRARLAWKSVKGPHLTSETWSVWRTMASGPIGQGLQNLAVATVLVATVALGSSAAGAAESRDQLVRILIVYQDSSIMSSQIEIAEGLSQHLGPPATPKLELYTEFLDSGRFSGADYVDRLADTLAAKYGALPPQIVVTVGPDALRFMLDHRNRIAPTATLVFGDMSERSLKRLAPPQDVRGVVVAYDVSKTIDLAATLQPEAERIVVISGSAEFDRYWQESARQKLGDRYRDLPVEYLSGLTLDAFVSKSRKLSPQTILLLLTIFEDAGGVKYRPRDAVSKIAEASAAPSYGVLGSYVGSGILGGHTATYRSIGKDIAASIAKLLSGDLSDPGIVHANSRPVVDWRQLRRWGIKESRLPVDVDLHYYTPTLWEAYRWQIALVATALLAQTLAILALFYERRRRAAAELQSRHRLLEVVHLNQSATAGALSASIAHELNQPLGAIRNNTAAAEIVLRGDKPDLDLIRQILADIRDDDQRADDIIQRLRGMLKKRSEIDWQEFDVRDVVNSAVHILHGEAEQRKVLVDCVQAGGRLSVRADRVHLQQVILNIATNAMDAMLDSAPDRRRLMLRTDLSEGSKVAVSVADTGKGFPGDQLARVFETFYTTKANGTGLGLTIARAIVETYGGKIWAANRPEGGAVVSFVLPLARPV